MAGRFLLDTSIAIAVLRNETAVANAIAAADEVLLPSIAAGELFYGAAVSGQPSVNTASVESLIAGTVALGCDLESARRYAYVKNYLRSKGKPIPENDIWIAALALQHGLTLATRDAHFKEVDMLPTVQW